MPILALDTSTLVSSVAVASEDKLIAEIILQTKLTHSEVLMPHIKQVLLMAKISKEELDGIAISIGPGSFTGLRIGLATAKSLAYALNLPIVGVSTLEALAYHYAVPGIYIAALLDAQKGNAYAGLYSWQDDKMQEVCPVVVDSFEKIVKRCEAMDRPVVFVGDIVQKKATVIKAAGKNVFCGLPHMVMPRAANVAVLGLKKLGAGQYDNVMDIEPIYIRRSEAEVLWEQRHKKAAL